MKVFKLFFLVTVCFFCSQCFAQYMVLDSALVLSNKSKSEVLLHASSDGSFICLDNGQSFQISKFQEILYFGEEFTTDRQPFIVLCTRSFDAYYYYLYGYDRSLNMWISYTRYPLASLDDYRFVYEYVKISHRNPFVYRFYTDDGKRYKTFIVNNLRSQELKENMRWFYFKD